MAQQRARIDDSEWNEYLDRRALETRAAERARKTHRERRAHEFADQKARKDAQIVKRFEFAYIRRERAAELEKARDERNRQGINPDAERMALAKVRHDEAARARDATLVTVEANRPEAIVSGAHLAAQTRREHAAEVASANSTSSAEYRAAIEIRVDAAARLRDYRAERAVEIPKIEREQRSAAALMAQQARETRLLREMGEDDAPVMAKSTRPQLRALMALMSEVSESSNAEKAAVSAKSQPVKRSPEKSEVLIDELRSNMAKANKKASKVKPDTGNQRTSRSRFRKMLDGLRRAA